MMLSPSSHVNVAHPVSSLLSPPGYPYSTMQMHPIASGGGTPGPVNLNISYNIQLMNGSTPNGANLSHMQFNNSGLMSPFAHPLNGTTHKVTQQHNMGNSSNMMGSPISAHMMNTPNASGGK
jgi:hypothetical protein